MKWEFLWLEASGLWNKNLPFSFGQSFQQSQRYNFKDGVFKYWQFVKVTTNSENSRASKYSLNIFPTIWLVNNLYFPTILCKYLDKFYFKLGLIPINVWWLNFLRVHTYTLWISIKTNSMNLFYDSKNISYQCFFIFSRFIKFGGKIFFVELLL